MVLWLQIVEKYVTLLFTLFLYEIEHFYGAMRLYVNLGHTWFVSRPRY